MKRNVMLKDLAYARSGDKGDVSNIGLQAFNKKNYEILRKKLTPENIRAFWNGEVKGDIKIYELPNLDSLEIVMHDALGGGATHSLRLDQTGKSMGQVFLAMEIEVND
ncbi:MAG: hypothetical protein V1850_05170 [Candidatus Bathyarchaeota archaeon]